MSKNQISAPVPSLGTRAFAETKNQGEIAIQEMAKFYESALEEPVSKARAIWIAASIVSFILLLLFDVTGAPITLPVLVYTAKRAGLFYKDEKGDTL